MFKKIANALRKTQRKVAGAIKSVIPFGKKLTGEDIELIEEILIGADVGVETTEEIIDDLTRRMKSGELTGGDALEVLEKHLLEILGEPQPIVLTHKPHIILMVGVNGTGKTTSIGKLAKRFKDEGKKVLLSAGDTFRAAAREQLDIWANRVGVDIIAGADGADPASVVFDSIKRAVAKNYDVVIADTAGRLHTKKNLMEELKKIARVSDKALSGAPHDTFLVLDATTGQNGLTQAEIFHRAIPLTGIILAKLDGTAKGGIAVAIKRKLGVPIRAVGIGEKIDDIEDFIPKEYVKAMLGIE
ncbi:signal recognition particle-docking protein FtsY [bacterium]|nr:MAG: signal recognition particle-docking protein FtsY [bacterium]